VKIAFIGCITLSCKMLQHLLTSSYAEVVGIVTCNKSSFNADFASLKPLASEADIPCFIVEGNKQNAMAEWLRTLRPDVIYCFGWSYLLRKEILQIPKLGVVGYHPAALPKNRGRHPIIWALALGLKSTASTFFFMDEGADSGDILSQETVMIDDTDDAGILYEKLSVSSLRQITDFTALLAEGKYTRIPQDHEKANYWRKRINDDGKIDWRMSAKSIHNLIRALTRPYIGAHSIFQQREVKIWKANVALLDEPEIDNVEPGKVLSVEDETIVVKCGEGALRIIAHEFPAFLSVGDYL